MNTLVDKTDQKILNSLNNIIADKYYAFLRAIQHGSLSSYSSGLPFSLYEDEYMLHYLHSITFSEAPPCSLDHHLKKLILHDP